MTFFPKSPAFGQKMTKFSKKVRRHSLDTCISMAFTIFLAILVKNKVYLTKVKTLHTNLFIFFCVVIVVVPYVFHAPVNSHLVYTFPNPVVSCVLVFHLHCCLYNALSCTLGKGINKQRVLLVTSCLRQGSFLGPLFCVIFIDDITSSVLYYLITHCSPIC